MGAHTTTSGDFEQTPAQKASIEKKNISFLYRWANAAYDSLALRLVSYAIGFTAIEYGGYKAAEFAINKDQQKQIKIAEQIAAENKGLVVICDQRKNASSGYTYMPKKGECETVTLNEAKDRILHPSSDMSNFGVAVFIAAAIGIGCVGANAAYKGANSLAEAGGNAYTKRKRKINEKYGLHPYAV